MPDKRGLEKAGEQVHDISYQTCKVKTLHLREEQAVLTLQMEVYQGDTGKVQSVDYSISPINHDVRLFGAKGCPPFSRYRPRTNLRNRSCRSPLFFRPCEKVNSSIPIPLRNAEHE